MDSADLADLVVDAPRKRGRRRVPMVGFTNPWFCPRAVYKGDQYPERSTGFATEYSTTQSLAFPLNFDTEYVTAEGKLDEVVGFPGDYEGALLSREPVTYQIKSTTDYAPYGGSIYASTELAETARREGRALRHPVVDGDKFIPFEYMRDHGETVDYWRDDDAHENQELPLFVPVVHAHFAVADIPLLGTGAFQNDIVIRFTGDRNRGIPRAFEQKRRLTTKARSRIARMPWLIRINGNLYRVGLQVKDTNALHGQAGYKDIAKTAGVLLEAKDFMRDTRDEDGRPLIENMDRAYFLHPAEYDRYALGDLRVSEILEKNVELSRGLYRELGVEAYFKHPALSIGATVAHITQSILAAHFGVPPEELTRNADCEAFLDRIVGPAKADHLRRQVYDNSKDLAKVEGGLCRSKRTVTPTIKGDLIDLDLGGAYASRMAMMVFPCGHPVIESFKGGMPIRLWLRDRRRRLVPGTWIARVSTTAPLTHEQDLFLSYWGAGIEVQRKADDEGYEAMLGLDTGYSKSLGIEIRGGALNDTMLEIVEKALSPRHRDDLLSNLVVTASAYYPADQRMVDPGEWWALACQERVPKSDEYKWYGMPFGEVLIDRIRAIRAKYPKESPQNLFAKLVGNTQYGVSISRYFQSSNMIFGANVTAGVRSAMWLAEKGLNLFGSITDGHCFDPAAVLYRHPRAKYFASHLLARLGGMSQREIGRTNQFKVAPLHPDHATLPDETINRLCLEHLQTQFPDLDFLNAPLRKLDTSLNKVQGDTVVRYRDGRGFLEFEMKHRVSVATMHGSANYLFDHPTGTKDGKGRPLEQTLKARSYRTARPYYGYAINDGGRLAPTNDYAARTPPAQFFEDLRVAPHAVPLRAPFVSWAILKPDEFAQRFVRWSDTALIPGDTYPRAGMWRPFSLAQFNFRTVKQFETWNRVIGRLKSRNGYSLELYFLNENGTLDYQAMLETVESMIAKDVLDPVKVLDAGEHMARNRKRHPGRYVQAEHVWESLQALKEAIHQFCGVGDSAIAEITADEFGYFE